jgi:hypothetical protein
MAQAVSRLAQPVEAGIRARSVDEGFVVDNVALGQVSILVLRFSPVNIIPPWLSIHIYHLEDEQGRWWPQFRDVVSLHRHDQRYSVHKDDAAVV